MFTEALTDSIVTISWFSLAWFAVGVAAGKHFAPCADGRAGAKSSTSRSNTKSERTELYIGNLPYDLKSKDLRRTVEEYGKVQSVRIIENKFNGKSKGFAFVEMAGKADAYAVIKALNGKELSGRKLVVNEAKTRAKD